MSRVFSNFFKFEIWDFFFPHPLYIYNYTLNLKFVKHFFESILYTIGQAGAKLGEPNFNQSHSNHDKRNPRYTHDLCGNRNYCYEGQTSGVCYTMPFLPRTYNPRHN